MATASVFTWVDHLAVEGTWLVLSDDQFKTTPSRKLEQVAAVVGPPGAIGSVGPGFKLVGNEIRYDIASLTGA